MEIDNKMEDLYSKGFYDGWNAQIENRLEVEIEKLHPYQSEVIVLRFNFDDIELDRFNNIFNNVKTNFPYNDIVVIPDKVSLESWGKDALEEYASIIAEIIKEL